LIDAPDLFRGREEVKLHRIQQVRDTPRPELCPEVKNRIKLVFDNFQVWPIRGGEWIMHDCDGMPELFVTGHADGCLRFWDASAGEAMLL